MQLLKAIIINTINNDKINKSFIIKKNITLFEITIRFILQKFTIIIYNYFIIKANLPLLKYQNHQEPLKTYARDFLPYEVLKGCKNPKWYILIATHYRFNALIYQEMVIDFD